MGPLVRYGSWILRYAFKLGGGAMKRRLLILGLAIQLFLFGVVRTSTAQTHINPNPLSTAYFDGRTGCGGLGSANYILTTFNGTLNQLEIQFSPDMVNWCYTQIQTGITLRDPRIFKYATDGNFYIAATDASGNSTDWDLLSSSNGVDWGPTTLISMSSIPGTAVWAPSWVVDTDGTVHIFVAVQVSSVFHTYEMHPMTSDLKGAWSPPVAVSVTGGTTNGEYDPFITCIADGYVPCTSITSGNTYALWFTDNNGFHADYATSSALLGPYTIVGIGNWDGFQIGGAWEGQYLMYNPNTSLWRRWIDDNQNNAFEGAFTNGQLVYTDSADWATWSPITWLATGAQAKHGAIYPYP